MIIQPAHLKDILLIEPTVYGDQRGFFMETFQARRFEEAGLPTEFVQDNHSGSRQGSLRGLHYQIHQPQGKLIRVVAGEVYDVAVDLRRSSPSLGQWIGARLSAQNRLQLWIPPGFAHGFYVMSEWAELVYKATAYYAPQYERTLLWNDPELRIDWPLIRGVDTILSDKDRQGVAFNKAELYE